MVESVGSIGALLGGTATKRSLMNREQFMKLLAAEISAQDPFAPMDNTQFLQQLVALEEVQASATMSDGMSSFMNFFQLSIASGTIGKSVKGLGASGDVVQGLVLKVKVQDGDVLLSTTAGDISFRNVMEVQAPIFGAPMGA